MTQRGQKMPFLFKRLLRNGYFLNIFKYLFIYEISLIFRVMVVLSLPSKAQV